ncbi:xanthine dehydrogenase accessory protein XdhC [Sphaerotilus sp.]|uniref:xanthine dehydrogenase accessory protein XdhC n=1 Tax=Sphaerotilus sp. TaxID=2093942 RepID=UPI002ACDF391|nr:xanthine dehydrogenase accessory protein XdhC [Sphaerotilus sp.]MDZ7857581.1 xanthine dehydrogenase accessory protein XdhC [Sphaerotilus sp.]
MTPGVLQSAARHWLAQGRRAVEVQILSHRGSTPRETGTRMVVAEDAVLGTIGGGHLELLAITAAREGLRQEVMTPTDLDLPLGPALGQCCGGRVVLRLQTLTTASLADWPAPQPRFFLQLHGAGHVGRAIVRLLADIDCRVQWIDEREEEFPTLTGTEPPHIERVCVDTPEAEVALAPPGAFFLVMTHRHDLDERITEAALRRGDAGYCGLIGSQTKRARFLHRFEKRGVDADAHRHLTCPIGLRGITGKEPEVLAVSVVAQLLGLPGSA